MEQGLRNYVKTAIEKFIVEHKPLAPFSLIICPYISVLMVISQQCLSILFSTYLLNFFTPLRCTDSYHILHFILAHILTISSGAIYRKFTNLTDHFTNKIWNNFLEFGYIRYVLRKLRKIKQALLFWKVEKPEDQIELISDTSNKYLLPCKNKKLLNEDLSRCKQNSNYKDFWGSYNLYERLPQDLYPIIQHREESKWEYNLRVRKYHVLAIKEIVFTNVSQKSPMDASQSLIAIPHSSKSLNSDDESVDINYRETNTRKQTTLRFMINEVFEKVTSKSLVKSIISKNKYFKNVQSRYRTQVVWSKCMKSFKIPRFPNYLKKRNWNFKRRKRYKDLVVFDIQTSTHAAESNKDNEWYHERYDQLIIRDPIAPKEPEEHILKKLKQNVTGCCSNSAPAGFRHTPELKSEPLELTWGDDAPKSKFCTCPTPCICKDYNLLPPRKIPKAKMFDPNICDAITLHLLKNLPTRYADLAKKYVRAPTSAPIPKLIVAVDQKRTDFEKLNDQGLLQDKPPEFCSSKCKRFYLKTDETEFKEFKGRIFDELSWDEDKKISEEQPLPKVLPDPIKIMKSDEQRHFQREDMYTRPFAISVATQPKFDENGNLLLEITDRIIFSESKDLTVTDISGNKVDLVHFDHDPSTTEPTGECNLENMFQVPSITGQICKLIDSSIADVKEKIKTLKEMGLCQHTVKEKENIQQAPIKDVLISWYENIKCCLERKTSKLEQSNHALKGVRKILDFKNIPDEDHLQVQPFEKELVETQKTCDHVSRPKENTKKSSVQLKDIKENYTSATNHKVHKKTVPSYTVQKPETYTRIECTNGSNVKLKSEAMNCPTPGDLTESKTENKDKKAADKVNFNKNKVDNNPKNDVKSAPDIDAVNAKIFDGKKDNKTESTKKLRKADNKYHIKDDTKIYYSFKLPNRVLVDHGKVNYNENDSINDKYDESNAFRVYYRFRPKSYVGTHIASST